MNQRIKLALAVTAAVVLATVSIPGSTAQDSQTKYSPSIPKVWTDQAMQSLQVPLANAAASPKHISADYYYRMPVRPIYKTYPVYHPDKEPRAYLDNLKQQEPEIVFDASTLRTEADWIKAGELVFDAPIEFESGGTLFSELRGRGSKKVMCLQDFAV